MIGARARGRVRRVARVTKHATPLSLLSPPTGSSPAHTTPPQDPESDRNDGRRVWREGMAADAQKIGSQRRSSSGE